jgi:hypothetical protein
MKLTAWVAAISLALGGALLSGCGERDASQGGSSASGGSSSSGASGTTPRSPGGGMSGSGSPSSDPAKRSGSSGASK